MTSTLEWARVITAAICFPLLAVFTPFAALAQQSPPPPQQDGGAQELKDLVKDLFGGLGAGASGGDAPADKAGGADGQTLETLLQGLGKKPGSESGAPAAGDPLGGLVQDILGGMKAASGQDCQSFIATAQFEDALAPRGSAADRQNFQKLQELMAASLTAAMQQQSAEQIEYTKQALAVDSAIAEWPSSVPRGVYIGNLLSNLSGAYLFRRNGDTAESLENAIDAGSKALDHLPREGVCADQRGIAQINLGGAYAKRIRGERAENIELAIAAFEAALQTVRRETVPQTWALTQNNLGAASVERVRGRKRENQERGIAAFNAALEVWDRQKDPDRWSSAQTNLGSAYNRRITGDRADNIERAIAAFEAGLTVRKRETSQNDGSPLPAALGNPAILAGDQRDGMEAGAMIIVEPGRWANSYHNLANAYRLRIRGDRAENIERAIAANEMSLQLWKRETFPERWAWAQSELGEGLMLRVKGDRAANVDRAIERFRAALEVRTTQTFPRGHLATATALGQALNARRDWAGALEAFDAARASFRVLFDQGLNEAEARDLLQEAGPLFTDAAYAAAAKGEVERALALLEEGKARLLVIALKLDRLGASPADRTKLDGLRRQIHEGEAAYDAAHDKEKAARIAQLAKLRADLLRLVDAAEAKSGPQADGPMKAATQVLPKGGALVAPIISDAGGKAIVITREKGDVAIEAIDLPGLDRARLNRLLGARDQGGWLGAYAIHHLDPASQAKRLPEWLRAIEGTADELGGLLAAPLTQVLAARGLRPGTGAPLAILPVGPLGLLPLGLARHPSTRRHLMEDYTVNFAPSLAALVAAKSRGEKSEAEPKLTAVVNPTGDLPYTELESALVASRFAADGRRSLVAKDATSDAVLAALKGREYWHFSSHGFFDWDEPRGSGLVLAAGKPLTVGALMDAAGIGAPRLAVLSACETGLYDIATTPNEFTGLPTAFMRLGAGGVLATLWPVNDLSTALLIARFYDLHKGEKLAPAAALRAAQDWLRGASEAELKAYLRAAVTEGRLPGDAMRSIDAMLRSATAQGGRQPFAHPYYWSGFTLTGL